MNDRRTYIKVTQKLDIMDIKNLTMDDVFISHENKDVQMLGENMMDYLITAYLNIMIKDDPESLLSDKKALFERLLDLYIDDEVRSAAEDISERGHNAKKTIDNIKNVFGGESSIFIGISDKDIDNINSKAIQEFTESLIDAKNMILDFYFNDKN